MKRLIGLIVIALLMVVSTSLVTLVLADFYGPGAPPTTKWNKKTGCTTVTLGDAARTPGPTFCDGGPGTPVGTGTWSIPPCPPFQKSYTFCQSGGRVIIKSSVQSVSF